MALNRTLITAPANTSFNSLGSSLTAVASCAAVSVSASANVTDHEVTVTITGPATFTASASTLINFFLYASIDGTTWPGMSSAGSNTVELVDGTDKAITLSANGQQGVYLGSTPLTVTGAGTSMVFKSRPMSVAAACGGSMPSRYVIVVQNQAGAALAASGHSILVEEIYYN